MKPTVKVSIDGTAINNYTELSVVQRMYDHHTFRIVVNHEVMETLGHHSIEQSKGWIGQSAIISLGTYDFVGIVTAVNAVHHHAHFGDLVITGYSKTILLEAGPHLCSWSDKSLRDIVSETGSIASGINLSIKPKYSDTIPYLVQHRESHFGFLRRIACEYNEWFFYDGEKLLFGEPSSFPTVPLVYGKEVQDVQIAMRIRPVKYDAFSYHSMRDEQMDGSTQNSVAGLDELGSHAFGVSSKTFNFNPRISSSPRIPSKGSLDDMLKNAQSAAAANLSTISGHSITPEVRTGAVIDLKSETYDGSSWQSKPYGRYLVTAVHHRSGSNFSYTNSFEAIPAGVKILPEPDIKSPIAYPQIATVLSNDDPEQKGRIQVQMQWQQLEGMKTNWIRVMTPDAGKSDLHSQNRGHVFIPELGDQVMVGFRYGDPSRPFVMGSMFHGMTGAGGDKQNVMKTIVTRSGHVLAFDDTRGAESITITDKNSNIIVLDTAGSNIRISAPENIDIDATNITISATENLIQNAKNMQINVEEDLNISVGENKGVDVGKNISTQAGEEYKLSSKNAIEFVREDKLIDVAKTYEQLSADANIEATNGDMIVHSNKVAKFQGGKDVKISIS